MSKIPPAGRLLLASCAAIVLTAAGCGTPRPVAGARTPPASTLSDVALGEPFEIGRGSSVLVEGHRLRFETVREDSRCPQGTTCVWEGQAVATFSFVGTQAIGQVLLTLPGGTAAEPQPEQSTTREGYRFTLLALDPYPGTTEADASETPVATIQVEAAGS